MKKLLFCLLLLVGIASCGYTPCNHDDDKYTMVILEKDSDMGSVFLCFGSETQYYIKYKVKCADNKWHYYDREVPREVFRKYNVGDTVIVTHDSSNGYMGFVNNHDLGF